MASINRSDSSSDRRGTIGKGDLPVKGSEAGVRSNLKLWGKSDCCNTGFIRLNGKLICEACNNECSKKQSCFICGFEADEPLGKYGCPNCEKS